MFIRNTKYKKKTVATAGASLALAAALVGVGLTSPSTAAWAASTAPGIEQVRQATPTPAPKPGRPSAKPGSADRQQQRGQMQQAYLNALAGRLGVSADQLQEAMKQARIDLINQAVSEGKLDQERANRMIQAIQSGQGPGMPGAGQGPRERGPQGPRGGQGPQGGPGQQGQRPGGPGMMGPGGQVITDALGMTQQELRAELQAGKSLAQVAEAKGVSRDTLKAKLLEAHKARIDAAVAAGRMTAEQAQKANERINANIDQMLDRVPGQRPQRQRGATGS
jgi:hypothetical protein